MDFRTSTILITGGNSGIGKGLATALQGRGAKIVITGRDAASLQHKLDRNPGMVGYAMDVTDAVSIKDTASKIIDRHPDLNVVIHNAGIMEREDIFGGGFDVNLVERTVATNLLGPIRLTAVLLPHLRQKAEAAIVTVSSGLAFVPLAQTPTFSATKAAIHSWSQSLRHQLRETNVEVVEIVPPMVATELMPNHSAHPWATSLQDFVDEAVALLCVRPTRPEVVVQRAMLQRTAEKTGSFSTVFAMINPD
jgi:uncharacterized oxidoreductase